MENNETKINEEMRELTDEELAQVTGGNDPLDRSGERVTGTSKPNIEAPGYHEPGIE